MKFIHTSDWHIGRQFHNVSLLQDQAHVLSQLIEYIKQHAIDALLISGDIYDRSVPPAQAVSLLDETLAEICMSLKVPVILISGNHDGAARLGFGARQMDHSGLYIRSKLEDLCKPVSFDSDGCRVNIYGIPYVDPETVRNFYGVSVSSHEEALQYLVSKIDEVKVPDEINIVMSHCFIDGSSESDSERPLSIGGADRVSYKVFEDFDYAALGHLHGAQYKGKESIRYSGSLLKYSFSEQHHKKAVTLVELDSSGLISTETLPLKPLRDMRILEGELDELINQGKTDPRADDYLLVRLTDRHALLDAMNRLRAVYPNVLHLEKPGMLSAQENLPSLERLKRNEFDMFEDFFKQVHGDDLSPDQRLALTETLEELHESQLDQIREDKP